MTAIHSIGIAVPSGRLPHRAVAAAWGSPARPGERAVAAADEDSLTLAVEAGEQALRGFDRRDVALVVLATTTPPYGEKLGAAIAAQALDLPAGVRSIDLTNSLRGGIDALQAAADAVATGGGAALVLAADCRAAEPGSPSEPTTGHGAVAVLVTMTGTLAAIGGFGSVTDELTARWRGSQQAMVREFQPRMEAGGGYRTAVPTACAAALANARIDAVDIEWAGVAGQDDRSAGAALAKAGLKVAQTVKPVAAAIGYTGTPAPLFTLVQLLEAAAPGQDLLVAAVGDGANAVVLQRGTADSPDVLAAVPLHRRELTSYTQFLADRGFVADAGRAGVEVNAAAYRRVRDAALRRLGARCGNCGVLEYPPGTGCSSCGEFDNRTAERLPDRGTVFTFTHDHVVEGRYSARPITRCIIEFDSGARLYTALSDVDPDDVSVGMPVELVLRRRTGAGFVNYGWRARPVREA